MGIESVSQPIGQTGIRLRKPGVGAIASVSQPIGDIINLRQPGVGAISSVSQPIGQSGIRLRLKNPAPYFVTDLMLHVSADTLSLANNDPVALWQGDYGRCTQTTGSKQPLFKANIVNGLPAIWFDGLDDILWSDPYDMAPLDHEITFFAVAYFPDPTFDFSTGYQRYIAAMTAQELFIGYPNQSYWRDLFPGRPIQWFKDGVETRLGATQAWHVFSIKSTVDIGVNVDAFSIGSYLDFAKAYWYGYIAEVFIYNSILSDSDHLALVSYLMTKYGI